MNPTEQITGQTNEVKKEERPALLELRQIEKSFGDTRVLKGIDLTVGEGEFVTLLGSSGCGKTTTLRIIAGTSLTFSPPTTGPSPRRSRMGGRCFWKAGI